LPQETRVPELLWGVICIAIGSIAACDRQTDGGHSATSYIALYSIASRGKNSAFGSND